MENKLQEIANLITSCENSGISRIEFMNKIKDILESCKTIYCEWK
jgi:hypothetical protein